VLESRPATRIGGDVVAESLRALGAEIVFGLPGVHALPIWEGLRATELRVLGFRQELNAAFAADGYARVTRRPAPLVVSTGPGALMTLAPLEEALMAFVPLVVISSQIEAAAIGAGKGHLHETPDQTASFAPLVKWVGRAHTVGEITDVLAEAWSRAATAPQGPTYVEVPFDVLQAEASGEVGGLDGSPTTLPLPPADELDAVARLLAEATAPAIVAGGGVVRSGAEPELLQLAERLDAPVATTYTGKGAIPERHPLALGSAWDDAAHRELLVSADAVLCVGSWLGYELTDSYRLRLGGTLVQVDAEPSRIGLNLPARGLTGDAKPVLGALLERVPGRAGAGDGAARMEAARMRIAAGLAAQPRVLELELLDAVEGAVPVGAAVAWDSTILAYAACAYARVSEPRGFLYPAGSSTLGYGFPAALGAAAATGRALAVAGDGGFQYGLAELATARQHSLDVALLLVDDGGYGILREYQEGAGYASTGVDLAHADFVALCAAYGVPVRATVPETIRDDLAWALDTPGPAVVVLREKLVLPAPTA
jgi:acetolactate synthase-1/2/3 large subunit